MIRAIRRPLLAVGAGDHGLPKLHRQPYSCCFVAFPLPCCLRPQPPFFKARRAMRSCSPLRAAVSSMVRSIPFSRRDTPPPPLRAGVAVPPRCKGQEKLPKRHTCCVSAAPGDAFPISTII